MRRMKMLVVPVIAVLAGCAQFAGPIAVRHMDRADAPAPDGGRYTPYEQGVRARERYNIPSDDWSVGPALGVEKVSPTGR
jgi:hypothetical protein